MVFIMSIILRDYSFGFFDCFRRIDMIEELEKMAGLKIPKDLSSEEANKYLKDACLKYDIRCPPPEMTGRLLDKVIYILFHFWLIYSLFSLFTIMQKHIVALFPSQNGAKILTDMVYQWYFLSLLGEDHVCLQVINI